MLSLQDTTIAELAHPTLEAADRYMGNDPGLGVLLAIARVYEAIAQQYSVARVDNGGSSHSNAAHGQETDDHHCIQTAASEGTHAEG